MSNFFKSPVVRASIIVAALGFGAAGVLAQPLATKPVQPLQGASSDLLLVDHKKSHNKKYKHYDKKRHWRYNKRYGNRYRYRRHGYGYHYGGWWYQRPYWRYNEPGIYLRFNL